MHDFSKTLAELEEALKAATYKFFQERGIPFDPVAYNEMTTLAVSDIAREMLFFGAELFPIQADGEDQDV